MSASMPILDLTLQSGRQAAASATRERARSAVLERFDVATSRRQFSLDQAATQRVDRTAKLLGNLTAKPVDKPPATGRADPERPTVEARPQAPATSRTESASSPPADAPRPARSANASDKPLATPAAGAKPEPGKPGNATPEAAADEDAQPKAAKATETSPAPEAERLAAEPLPAPPLPAIPETAPDKTAAAAAPPASQTVAPDVAAAGHRQADKVAAAPAAPGPDGPQAAGETRPDEAGGGARFAAMLDPAADPAPPAGARPDPTAALAQPTAVPANAVKAAEAPTAATATKTAQDPSPPVPLGAVPMTIALRALQDTNRFDIRLDPIELGRIDVRLDIDREKGTVSADLVVDRPATLALLQRDADALQQALSQAGLDASAGVSLSLRDGAGGGENHGRHPTGAAPIRQHAEPADTINPGPMRVLRLSGLDIRI